MLNTSLTVEGYYSIEFAGVAGWGIGTLILDTGNIIGSDAAGGIYDGTFKFNARTECFDIRLMVTVPAGTWLVTGVPAQDREYSFVIEASIPRNFSGSLPILVPTRFGPVNVVFRKLRDFPP